MEDLNKTQLTLLTLLVSFVTSIATGIITVSLLQEAPQSVTQTINRVVQQTIEKVVPAEQGSGTEKVREITVVVKEEDLVIDAINKNSKNIVRIKDTALVDGVSPFYGIGFLISDDGIVVSDRRDILFSGTTYLATFDDGTSLQMKFLASDDNAGLAFFQIIKDPKKNLPGEAVTLAPKELALGQSVIAIEGEAKNTVSIGRVVSFDYGAGDATPSKPVLGIETDIIPKTNVFGGPLVNLSGEVVGIRISRLSESSQGETFASISILKAAMTAALKK